VTWRIEYAKSARKSVEKLEPGVRKRLRAFIETRLAHLEDPRWIGRSLKGRDLWRYRVGDFRLICEIRDRELVILVILVGDRKHVYRKLK